MADVTIGAPGCEAALMPAERLKDGRWSIGYVAGPGGTFQILLPDGADPSALTAAEIQAAHDGAAAKAKGDPHEGVIVATSACETCPFGPGNVCRDEYQGCICSPREPGEGVREAPPGYWVEKDWGWEWGTADRPDQRIDMEMSEIEAISACRGHRAARQSWHPVASAPYTVPLLVAWAGVGAEPHIAMRWMLTGVWSDYREGYELDPPPTHWMPLPAPPLDVRSNGQAGQARGRSTSPSRPGCPKRGKQPPDAPVNAGPCCHPPCNGTWGTGCFHCHHPRFLDVR